MGYQLAKNIKKMLFYIIYILAVALVILVGGALFFNQELEIDGLENSLVTSRLLYSEDCLASKENIGEINTNNLFPTFISECTGIKDGSKQGLKLRLKDLNNNLINEIEINKVLTSQCLIGNLKNIREDYSCSYSKHYVSFNGNNGILEILVANEINK